MANTKCLRLFTMKWHIAFCKIRQVEFEKDVPREINVDIEVSRNVAVFFWKDEMTPVSEKIVYDDFDKDGLFPIMNYMKKISMN